MIININGIIYKVYWKHLPFEEIDTLVKGVTHCTVKNLLTEVKMVASAFCSPIDQFNKQKGRIISLTRAIRNFPKEDRKKFWNEYKKNIGFR